MSNTGYKLKLKRGLEAVKSFAKHSADLRQLSLLGLVETNFASLEISLTKAGQTALTEFEKEFSEGFDRSSLSMEELLQLPNVKLFHRAKDMADDVVVLNLTVFEKLYDSFYEDWLDYGYWELEGGLLRTLAEKQLLGQDTTEEIQDNFLENFLKHFKENWEHELEKYNRDNI